MSADLRLGGGKTMNGDPKGTDWPTGYLAFIDAEGRNGEKYTAEPVRWDGSFWDSMVGRGAWSPRYVTSVRPLHLVSLDAAVEAAAKLAYAEANPDYAHGWAFEPKRQQDVYRERVREMVTGAVTGGAR